mgnify:FL=1
MVTDMTNGRTFSVLLKFSLPMLLSVAFQQLYNIVDSVIAGNFVSDMALGAIGASYPVTMIFMAVATGGSVGASVVVARLFGSKNYTYMKTAINTALVSFAAIAGVLTVIGCALCSPMLALLGTPDDIFADSDIYLRVYVLGLLFLFIYNACNGIFTALGDSKTPLFFLIASSLGNIGLDLLFVIVFQMGVAGVAWATFAAQGAAGVAAFFVLLRRVGKIQSDTPEKPKIFSSDALKQISRISVPSILQSSFVSVGNLFVQSLVNSFGSSVIGGYASAIKLNTFAITCFSTLSNSVSNFCAQNIGADKTDRVKTGVKSGMLMCLVIAIPFVVCFLLFGGTLVNLFATQANAEIIATGSKFLTIVSPFYFFVCIKIVIDGGVRGCGVMTPFMISTCLDLALRVIFAYILSPFFGSDGIWLSWPVGWVLALVVDLFFYNYYIRKGKAFTASGGESPQTVRRSDDQ